MVIKMQGIPVLSGLLLVLTAASAWAAEEIAALPTPEHPAGWRNDGTGHYPGVTPPTKWSQTATNGTYDCQNIAWKVRLPSHSSSSPLVVGNRIYVTGNPGGGNSPMDLLCLDHRDGRVLWMKTLTYCNTISDADKKKRMTLQVDFDAARDHTIFIFQDAGIYAAPIPTRLAEDAKLEPGVSVKWREVVDHPREGGQLTYGGESGRPEFVNLYATASPLIVDGLIYCVTCNGVLIVIDGKEGKIVYVRVLEMPVVWPGVSASLALAGGNIYILSSEGTALVIKPGRVYQEVARNTIESLYTEKGDREKFLANPVFAGKRMFLRGEQYLYCVGP